MGKRRTPLAQRSSPSPFGDRVRGEQVAMLYSRNRLPPLVGVPFGLLVCAFAWSDGPHSWLVACFALDALYRRDADRASTASASWGRRYVVALGVDGAVWSLLILLFAGPSSG